MKLPVPPSRDAMIGAILQVKQIIQKGLRSLNKTVQLLSN